MSREDSFDERLEAFNEKYRQEFRACNFEYQRLYREYSQLRFYNIIKKIKISAQMKKAKEKMDSTERKYFLTRPSVD